MPPTNQKPHIFVSYSHRDAALKKEFDTILRVMQLQGFINHWTDAEIQPGDRWSDEIAEAMERSQIILFLVSNNFLASDYIRNVESPKAMRMMDEGRVLVVPILLRDTPGWKHEDWHCLQALPSESKSIMHSSWRDPQEAYADVDAKLRDIINLLPDKLAKQAERWGRRSSGEEQQKPLSPLATSSIPVIEAKSLTKESRTSRAMIWSAIAVCAAGIAIAGAFFMKRGGVQLSTSDLKHTAFIPKDYFATAPFENSLGMRFVTLPGTEVLCSTWELRLGDFKNFAESSDYRVTEKMSSYELDPKSGAYTWADHGRRWNNPGFEQSDDHPVVGITLTDAKRFCEWLTKKERTEKSLPAGYEYRIIRDEEWSLAVGDTLYPWNPYETPPSQRGNYGGLHFAFDQDNFPRNSEKFDGTTPVGTFASNELGIFDLGGNLMEICDTPYRAALNSPYLLKKYPDIDHARPATVCSRGGAWHLSDSFGALTELRWASWDRGASSVTGFRVVLSPINSVIKRSEEMTTVTSFDFGNTSIGGRVVFAGKPSGSGASCVPITGQDFKNFEAEVRYRVTDISTRELDFGVAFEFREGTNARQGYRVFVNGGTGTWGRGYWNSQGIWQEYPFDKMGKGQMNLDGSPNSLRVIVRGNTFWLYSNDCLLGSKEYDSAPSAGPLKLLAQLSPANTTEKVTIEFDCFKVRDLN